MVLLELKSGQMRANEFYFCFTLSEGFTVKFVYYTMSKVDKKEGRP